MNSGLNSVVLNLFYSIPIRGSEPANLIENRIVGEWSYSNPIRIKTSLFEHLFTNSNPIQATPWGGGRVLPRACICLVLSLGIMKTIPLHYHMICVVFGVLGGSL